MLVCCMAKYQFSQFHFAQSSYGKRWSKSSYSLIWS